MNTFMKVAADEALCGMESGHGGPFGAVIVRHGQIIAAEHNRVLETQDPTMHAEVAAIRKACKALGRFSLHDCEIYSTCMPCPMCLAAIMWAKIPVLYYGTDAADAADAGFDDEYIYGFIKGKTRATSTDGLDGDKLSLNVIDKDECNQLFAKWKSKRDRNNY